VSALRVGVAVSDVRLMIATPVATLDRARLGAEGVASELGRLREGWRAGGGLVVGYPVLLDGSEGPACQRVAAFARRLEALLGVPAALWDERFSTQFVRQWAAHDRPARSRKRAAPAHLDDAAAAFVLQGFLDSANRAMGET